MALFITLDQKTLGHGYPKVVATGNPGSIIPNTWIWSSDGDAIVNLNVLADGSLCEVIANSVGTCNVTTSVETVPGTRIEFIQAFEVIAPVADVLEVVYDPPVLK